MSERLPARLHSWRAWLAACAVFLCASAIAVLVWRSQVGRQQQLLARHTYDVTLQASRRLEVFLESHLRMARVFARRWATHENRDFSRHRFEEFATVLVEELRGYYAVSLYPADGESPWTVPRESGSPSRLVQSVRRDLFARSRATRAVLLSPPLVASEGETSFFAVLPLFRDSEFLGHLAVEFQPRTLVDDCFHHRIRGEFDFEVADAGRPIFRFVPDGLDWLREGSRLRSARTFRLRNRDWTLTVTPRRSKVGATGWASALGVLGLGLFLASGLAVAVLLLFRYVRVLRITRDRALREIDERRKAETAQRATEERYRNVFDSATDGLLVLDADGLVLEANPAAGQICGCPRNEMVSRPLGDFLAPEHRTDADLFRSQMEEEGGARLDSMTRRPDGVEVDLAIRGTRLPEASGGRGRSLAIITDVSSRVRALRRQVQLARKVLVAQDEERGRLSRELHDELGQILTALRLEVGYFERLEPSTSEKGRSLLANVVVLIEKAADELRSICRGLRPPLLDDLGLEPALQTLLRDFEERTGVHVAADLTLDDSRGDVRPETALAVYRIMQEALHNVGRHSRTKRVEVSVFSTPEELQLTVNDHGVGFDPDKVDGGRGCGLQGMRERASLVSGTLEISSTPRGTRVALRVPFNPLKARGLQ